MAASSSLAFFSHDSVQSRPSSISPGSNHLKTPVSSTAKASVLKKQPFFKELRELPMRADVGKTIKKTWQRILDAFVESTFQFMDQPLLPSQSNFAPVDEIGEAVTVTTIEGQIPADFPEGVYIRNGPNPLFGAQQSTVSMFGRSSDIWVEGEGMLHAVYFAKDAQGNWMVSYKNRYVETETFKMEKERNIPTFLPAIEGDSPAILASCLLNQLRFGKIIKYISNTNVFEHSGKLYSIAESHQPQEVNILNLETYNNWDVNGAWNRPFASHPKKAPGTGELVIMGVDARTPFVVLGVVSADGKKLKHKADLNFKRISICHDLGVTEKYNVIIDMPLILDINRLARGGPLMKYEKESYARIGVMPRYGDADSVKWFEIEPCCTFHLFNCFEDGDQMVVRGCRALGSIIPGPDHGHNKFEWFSRGFKPIITLEGDLDGSREDVLFFTRAYEWRLDMITGEVSERNLTGTDFSMEFPLINERLTGLYNKYAYTQVVDSVSSSSCGLAKFGSLAKLHFEEKRISKREGDNEEDLIKVDYHRFGQNQFCSGTIFVPSCGGSEEDQGWIVCFVHNEDTNTSQVHIIDARRLDSNPVVKITLPNRVPYGFHGTFIFKATQHKHAHTQNTEG